MTVCGYVSRGVLGYREKRFAPKPLMRDALIPVHYLSCPDLGILAGFVRQKAHTILKDLSKSEGELLAEVRENSRYEINRAAREGAKMKASSDPGPFLELYDAASRHKRLPKTDRGFLESYGKALYITEVWCESALLAAHVHIADRQSARVRLIRSASVYRDLDKAAQAKAGRANRFLHYQDFIYFKDSGFRWYDMGGYDPPGTAQTEELARVSEFKAGFGGQVVQEANYLSWALHLYRNRPRIRRQAAKGSDETGA